MKTINIDIKNLIVNPDNPRDEPQDKEEDAIRILFKSENKLIKLMKSIATNGYDITEKICIIEGEEPKKFLVMDGNRRVTCIKLLNNPNFLPENISKREHLLKKIKKISIDNNYIPITKVEAVLFDMPAEEQDMKRIIRNKHTGENGGEGRLRWDYTAQVRFDKDEFKQFFAEILDKILKVNKSYTTMERIVGDPDMRTKLGIIIDRRKPSINFINQDSIKKCIVFYI